MSIPDSNVKSTLISEWNYILEWLDNIYANIYKCKMPPWGLVTLEVEGQKY
jgi:hypothetical protein